jgi:PAS domain S-box-containing protein
VARVLREGGVVGLANHTVLVSQDGTERPVEDSAAPIRDDRGDVLGVIVVFHDVSERRRAEAVRSYLAAIVESSSDAIIGQTLDGTIVSWNKGAEALYGYAAAEVVGQPLAVLVPPDHRDELPGLLERLRRGQFVEHFETVRMRKDGGRVDVSLNISPIKGEGGRVIGASKTARDITRLKQVEADLRQANQAKDDFLAMLAHELRNPLAPLLNGLHVLRLAGGDAGAVEQARAMMERQARHLARWWTTCWTCPASPAARSNSAGSGWTWPRWSARSPRTAAGSWRRPG